MSEQIEEIFAYYGKQRDKSSQEMVIALLRELQEAEVCGLRLYYSYCLSMYLFSICTMRFRKVMLKQQNRKR